MLGLKRGFIDDDNSYSDPIKRRRFSPRKVAAVERFNSDLHTLQRRHPSVNPALITTILETCENNAQDASVSLSLVETGPHSSDSLPSTPSEGHVIRSQGPEESYFDSMSLADFSEREIPSIAEKLSSAIRSADSDFSAKEVAEKALNTINGNIVAAERKAKRNIEAVKTVLKALHQQNSKWNKNKEAALGEIKRLNEALTCAEQRAQSAERTVELLRWQIDQYARSFSRPFGDGGPTAGGVF